MKPFKIKQSMATNMPNVLILLLPALGNAGYEHKQVPTMKKFLDFNSFTVHIIGSATGSRALKTEFRNVHTIPFGPTNPSGLNLYVGYFLYLLCAFFKLLILSSTINVNIILSIGGHPYSGFIVALVAKLTRKKSIIRIAEITSDVVKIRYKMGSFMSKIVTILGRISLVLSDVVITNREMSSYFPGIASKQLVLSQGVELEMFTPGEGEPPYSKDFRKVITVSRLEKLKGLDTVLKAISILKTNYPSISYHLVGSGPGEQLLRREAASLDLNDNVIFHGHVPHESVPDFLRGCDVFVFSSATEGMPSAVLEAMACGLPAVITKSPSHWESEFENEENALIVGNTPRELANGIERIMLDADLRQRLVKNGIDYVRKYHDSRNTKAVLTQTITSLVNGLG